MSCSSSTGTLICFLEVFEGGFQVTVAPLRAPFPANRSPSTEEYDYDSDSDLEDEFQEEEISKDEEIKDEDSATSPDRPKVGWMCNILYPLLLPNFSKQAPDHTSPAQASGPQDGFTPPETSIMDASIENYGHVIIVPDIAFRT